MTTIPKTFNFMGLPGDIICYCVTPFLDFAPKSLPRALFGELDPKNIPQLAHEKLELAHALTEQLYGLLDAHCLSKDFLKISTTTSTNRKIPPLTQRKIELLDEIANLVADVHDMKDGQELMDLCVTKNYYPAALRIYFCCMPRALLNKTHIMIDGKMKIIETSFSREDGRTILHTAVNTNKGGGFRLSLSFIRLILALDAQHKLGLLHEKSVNDLTPLDAHRKLFIAIPLVGIKLYFHGEIWDKGKKISDSKAVENLLLAHEKTHYAKAEKEEKKS